MRREFSAGGLVVRGLRGGPRVAAIRPQGKPEGTWALPKGLVDAGERPEEAARREVLEETGLDAELVRKLGDTRYVYTWASERVFKVVSFYLFRWRGGRIGAIEPRMRREVAEARWLPLADAPALLAYPGEREMAGRALAALRDTGL